MSRQDEIANRAVRKSTLRSLKLKKRSRLKQLKVDYENQIREVTLQYAEDPERLKAKYAAEDYARSERQRKRAERKIAREKEIIEIEKNIRIPSAGEEITSSIIQGIGCALFIAATAILTTLAAARLEDYINVTVVFYSLFGASMILMYLFSLLQHALTNKTSKIVFNRLSHVLTFFVIGFTYSAYSITKVQGVYGWVLFGIVWAIVLVGILFYAIAGQKHEKVNTVLYIIAGFSGLCVIHILYHALSTVSFTYLVLSAVSYVLGIVFYNLRKIKGMHVAANIFLLVGNVLMFFSLFFIN